MRNIYVLSAALEAVEDMLREPLSVDDLAQAVYCSASGLQKLFRYAFRCSVSEYIGLLLPSREVLNLFTCGPSRNTKASFCLRSWPTQKKISKLLAVEILF